MNKAKQTIRRFSRWLDAATDEWEPVERVLSEDLETALLQHPGRWVAMTNERIIAVGDSSTEVYEAAQAAGEAVPILWYVPESDTAWYFPVTA